MIIDHPRTQQVGDLRRLWKQAFGDPDAFLDAFFSTAFSPERCRCVMVEGQIAAALYWLDCSYPHGKLAYLYAVATDEAFRGRGLCHALMADTHAHLAQAGYAGTVLVPGNSALFALYRGMGYETACCVTEFTAAAGNVPAALEQISTREYAALRKVMLPENGVVQEGATLDFLQTQAVFYKGPDLLLAATMDADTLWIPELLGNAQAAGDILTTLGVSSGRFRTPGTEKPFAMFLSLADVPAPAYFGIALD